jgi:hypothetical protein
MLGGSGQRLLGIVKPAGGAVPDAEVELAVGEERTHLQRLGDGASLTVERLGVLPLSRPLPGGDVSEQAEHVSLVATFAVLAGERQRASRPARA